MVFLYALHPLNRSVTKRQTGVFDLNQKMIISSTRAILYPEWDGKSDYFDCVRTAALQFQKQIVLVMNKAAKTMR